MVGNEPPSMNRKLFLELLEKGPEAARRGASVDWDAFINWAKEQDRPMSEADMYYGFIDGKVARSYFHRKLGDFHDKKLCARTPYGPYGAYFYMFDEESIASRPKR